jgi:uncharacterized protein (TIGR02597 family)
MSAKTIIQNKAALAGAALLLAAIFPATATATAAEPVRTEPLGLIALTLPAGSTHALSVPLKGPVVFAGKITDRTATAIVTAGAGWTPNAFGPFETNPCLVRILDGPSQGRYFRVAGNLAYALTLDLDEDLRSLVAPGNRYEIMTADTLESLFGATGAGIVTAADPSEADNVILCEDSGWAVYYNDGVQWLREGGDASANATPILPDQGVLFVRRGGTPLDLTITGEVPFTKIVSELPGSGRILLANPFPMDITLEDLGLHDDGSWRAGSSTSDADYVQIRAPQGWLTYYYDGQEWRREGGGASAQNPVVPKGSAIVVVRRGESPVLHSSALPYSPN